MRLDLELVRRGLCESRTEAQECIEQGAVVVNGSVITKKTKQVSEADSIVVTSRRRFVSRGGEKLEGVLFDMYGNEDAVREHVSGKTAIDIGSSTGGFTDCLLRYGIAHVDAVDVGTGQFHESLQGNERITLFEQTDMRDFVSDRLYDIVVADLSFISLEVVFDTIVAFGHEQSEYFLLMKPQFEVGKGNTKKGIVKDETLVSGLLRKYEVMAKLKGLNNVSLLPCHIQGGDGNQEFFLYAKK